MLSAEEGTLSAKEEGTPPAEEEGTLSAEEGTLLILSTLHKSNQILHNNRTQQ